MNAVVLLCLFCISFSDGAPSEKAVESVNDEHPNAVPEGAAEPVFDVQENAMPAAFMSVDEDITDVGATFVQCPSGWFSFGSRCFLLVKTRMSWLNAESYCADQQGSLASVKSREEYQFLQNLAQIGGQTSLWIGAYNFQSTWLWIDRAGFYYFNWQTQNSVSSNPCGYMQATAGWINTSCSTTLPFICVRIQEC